MDDAEIMNKYVQCINYLVSKKIQNIPHHDKNLFQHLTNVYNKLRQWECREDICYAGLFHSTYFNNVDRSIIKNLIGNKAESLVYLYNKDKYQTKDLKIISLANELDKTYINVLDNIFDSKDIIDLYLYFRDIVPWNFIGSASRNNEWKKFSYGLEFKNKIEIKLKNHTENILKNFNIFELLKLQRAYASANPYGTIHEFHRDYATYSKGGITVMYYLNNNWNLKFAGETVFQKNDDIIRSVIPKPSRAVMFDGMIEHCARDVVRNFNDLRMVLTFKYDII